MTDHVPDTHQSGTATGPLALKSNLVLGPNARAVERWYCVSRDGIATLCVDEEDARANAAHCDQAWRAGSPHRAVQLVDAAAMQTLRDLLTQALALRDAPKWPLPGCDDTAKASEKWWRAVVAALGPNVAGERGPL